MKGVMAGIGALAILAACGRVPGGPPAGDYRLYEAASTSSSQHLSVIDSRTHKLELNLPLGTPSPDWAHLYTVQGNTLVDLDPHTGGMLHTMQLPGYFALPPATISGVPGGLSQDGHWLVLQAFEPRGASVPTTTHLLVIDTTYATQPQAVELPGFFNFDAVSNDGARIYLIERVTSSDYRVRLFNIGTGRLDPNIVFDKNDGTAAMTGSRVSGVPSPDGHWLYSLYVRPDKSAFIHALSLDGPLAFCLELPGSGYASNPEEFHWALAMSADGSHLYAANGAMGIVADVNTGGNSSPSITRVVHIGDMHAGPSSGFLAQDVQAKELGAGGAALSADGRTLVMSGARGVTWVDTLTMRERSHQLDSWNIWSLALSPDGSMVYAISDSGMIAELPMNGTQSANIFVGAAGQPLALVRVEAVP